METTKENNCLKCMGYGWYPVGALSPIGQMDASEWGKLVVRCPWCGSGYAIGDRYRLLLKIYKEEKE